MKLFFFFLLFPAKRVLRKTRLVIGITGTVGKTSTRMAITHILRSRYSVQTSPENFNTPFGMLLSLLDIHTSGKNMLEWIRILGKVYTRPLPTPEIIVLEYGIDTHNDMDALVSVCAPHIAVLTPIAIGHTEKGQFTSQEEIRYEKLKLIHAAQKVVIANAFDEETFEEVQKKFLYDADFLKKELLFFGKDTLGNVKTKKDGITFDLNDISYFAPVFGTFQAQIFAPALLIAQKEGIPPEEVQKSLSNFLPPCGRGTLFEGKNGEILWDYSYNSSPKAALATLSALKETEGFSRKIAILGNMNELGDFSEKEHENIGKYAAECADEIYFIGENEKNYLAFSKGGAEKKPIIRFSSARDALKSLEGKFHKGDLILVKGSQTNVYTEVIVEYLLKNEEDREKLCRRGKFWDTKRGLYFSSLKKEEN